DKATELSSLALKTILENKNAIEWTLGAISVVSPLLAYRATLNTYIRALDPAVDKGPLTFAEKTELFQRRRILVRNFNLVAIPVIA
ncbi:hypothetical protein JDS92_30320, partial [Bacillus cereus group sp. N12]|uniref:hypothetical protein n=1 Tax=Bacillus cereus group sp. N12 TaxID=2794586 RepID=UPI0018F67660